MTTLPHPTTHLPLLGGRPEDVALRGTAETLTYADLAVRVRREADALGPVRRLVLLPMRNDVDAVVALLGALEAGHPVVLVGEDDAARHDEIARTYGGAEDLHPDLALLLSTSGTTGSPKLVRLSLDNLIANATSIADYLGLTAADCAITSLPLHYCYGLSVLTSHLMSGGTVTLTDLSVADECFWELAAETRATGLAGVPFTFDLLDASGFADRELPDLRYVTQAGGRMAPDRVVRYARLGAERGWELFVMYGQTEATARMAYLPPYLAVDRPQAIGLPIPGGDFRLAPLDAPDGAGEPDPCTDVGELVYTGPNVMMGYAVDAADLARGHELTELRTGDLARQAPDGLWELCGRIDRHAKVFGLRLDLARLEEEAASAAGAGVAVVVRGETVHAFVDRPRSRALVGARLLRATGLPATAVRVHEVEEIPRTARGKTDLAALGRHAEAATSVDDRCTDRDEATADSLRDLYAVVLGRPAATVHDSFVGLGGDSLSFVEISAQLGRRLGHLPAGWQHLTPVELTARSRLAGRPRWRRGLRPVEIPALLRAIAIVMIVVAHTDLAVVMGGAHVLLGLAGFNLARFALRTPGRVARSRRIVTATAAFALPASGVILVVGQVTGDYSPSTAAYLNQALGSSGWTTDWQFWFLEALVWPYLALALLLGQPVVDRVQRRWPYGTAVTATLLTLALRYALTGVSADGVEKYSVALVSWCLALGWAAAEARTWSHRALVAALAVAGTWGFFPDDPLRQAVVTVGLCLLLLPWAVLLPGVVASAVHHVAQASFWIYLTHWQVYPGLEAAGHRVAAVAASVAVGLVAATVQARVSTAVRTRRAVAGRAASVSARSRPWRAPSVS